MTSGRRLATSLAQAVAALMDRQEAHGHEWLMRFFAFLLAALGAPPATAASAEPPKRVAISFDDVPRHAGAWFTPDERTDRLIREMKAAGIEQAAFFVTPGNLDKVDGAGGEKRIAAYAAAGHVIANHSWSHGSLNRMSAEDYLADVDKAQAWLDGREGLRPWFRYPYLHHGGKDAAKRHAVQAGLKARGLTIGYVTIDNYDWHLDALANRAKREGREVDLPRLCALYAETMVETSIFYDAIARPLLQRSPAHMLLLHETDLAANCIGTLAARYRDHGWQIISADEAYADPIAAVSPETWFLGSGRIAGIAHKNGARPATLVHERTDEAELERLFETRVMRH